ncbi:MAG: hypothetical protein IPG23_19015 [Burkholderiales bacterium]|nr:hypothetical protein [Burkholderiales bacterium]
MSSHIVLDSIGIDQGFFATKFTYSKGMDRSGSVIFADSFPSWAVRSSNSDVDSAPMQHSDREHDGVTVLVDGASYFVGKTALLASSSTGGLRIAYDHYVDSPDYKALFLGALFYISKHHKVSGSLTIERLGLGLPVNSLFQSKDKLMHMALGTHEVPCPRIYQGASRFLLKKFLSSVNLRVQP